MITFQQFSVKLRENVNALLSGKPRLFVTGVDKEELYAKYLSSYPEGTNPMFRERTEHDCGVCKNFIRQFGNVVVVKDNKLVSIWEFDTGSPEMFQPVVDALATFVKSFTIQDVFTSDTRTFGTEKTFEEQPVKDVITWHHLHAAIPSSYATQQKKDQPTYMAKFRDTKNVFKRSLDELTQESVETVLDLVAQKSLYKGDEWEKVLKSFSLLQKEYKKLPEEEKDNFCWVKSHEVGEVIGRIRNHSIGVLLQDISANIDLNEAVTKYEKIVAPANYKRPKAIFSARMLEDMRKDLEEQGLLTSLGRRFANIDDITVNNILFANKDSMQKMTNTVSDVFAEMKKDVAVSPKSFDKVEEVTIEHFVEQILPRTTNLELFLENKHSSNLVSLIAPVNKESKTLFKWDNGFSWAYNGNVTDSMKERVKALGGKVDGVLRFSIQWNEDGSNVDDLDAHCVEPNGCHIYYSNKGIHSSSGRLDVDIMCPVDVAVENITWTDKRKMSEGIYEFSVHCFNSRNARSGFTAEIEYDGQIYEYYYAPALRQDERIQVARVRFTKEKGLEFIQQLPEKQSSRMIWNIPTRKFIPVSVVMYSPNYWDEQTGRGNKHYFFMLSGCKNDSTPNGFFNEFLQEDLMKHRRALGALGSKMAVEQTDNQLSGVGFSSTQRNSVICKVSGHISRILKIVF